MESQEAKLYRGNEYVKSLCLIGYNDDFDEIVVENDGTMTVRTIEDAETNEGIKRMLVKFLMCNTENFDGYWMCCTEDLTNPYPHEVREDDWAVYANHAEVVDMRTIK